MIVSMKRLTLVALQSEEERLLEALQKVGSVEVIGVTEGDAPSAKLEKAEDRMQRLNDSIDAVKPYAKKKSFFTPQKREESLSSIRADADKAAAVTDKVEALLHEKTSLLAERDKLTAQKADLVPWSALAAPMSSIHSTKRVSYFVGYCAQKDQQKLSEQDFLEVQFFA
ncbi:MAG: hypothetical protein IJ138_10425, partial [Clostridia bacterium]|nr:hypothetical protein [Clostridia bacterium]